MNLKKTKIQTQLIQYTMCTHVKMYCQNKKTSITVILKLKWDQTCKY